VQDQGWQPFRNRADPTAASHIVSLARRGRLSTETMTGLRRARIVCSTRGDRLRVSLAPYNNEDDIGALAGALS
jgi:selenocysteine lyase/cysteine desulfurase